jgi:hypothetical protein
MSEHSDMTRDARESIRNLTHDPVTKMLLGNSQLTLAQLETLLADSLSSESETRKSYKRLFRPAGSKISRGAFNRTLIQAQNNVIRSIYTVLLLGYAGLFDSSALQPFLELADTIQSYVDETRKGAANERDAINSLHERLLEVITALAKRRSFRDIL